MLVSLRISNFILIDDCSIVFHPGLNVLTGETGAGKSIVVDALSLLVGERSTAEAIRDTKRDAVVEAEFELKQEASQTPGILRLLDQFGIPMEENVLLIKRTLSSGGRNRFFLNNTQCLLKQLRELGVLLLDLHGQHEHQSLLHKDGYLPLLDGFGSYTKTLVNYKEMYANWTALRKKLAALEEGERERVRRIETLQRQLDEITSAELKPGEEDTIEERFHIIRHAERLNESCQTVLSALSEENKDCAAILDQLDQLESVLVEMAQWDPSLETAVESWRSASIALHEISRDLQGYSQNLEFDPAELERFQQRRFLLRELFSKYGETIPEILEYQTAIQAELDQLQDTDQSRERLREEENEIHKSLTAQAKTLHNQRVKNAKKIASQVTSELASLGMKKAKFEIFVSYRGSSDSPQPSIFGPMGSDEVEFLITTIPDKPPRPLREVASGGEISRIMLALKCVFGQADPVPTMIFDEIDTGVGGKTADVVAERLTQLAVDKQVLCVTHLPHIASRADRNLRVDKREEKGVLISHVAVLNEKEKEEELVRMLGGENSAASKRYARELIEASKG